MDNQQDEVILKTTSLRKKMKKKQKFYQFLHKRNRRLKQNGFKPHFLIDPVQRGF